MSKINKKEEKVKPLFVGDVHGNWNSLREIIETNNPEIIIQCGDFGFFPHFIDFFEGNSTTKVYWCDGNHENHEQLNEMVNFYGRKPIELSENCFYMPRGSTLKLDDGRNVLFMGGALSIDKCYRTEGRDYFRSETISDRDLIDLTDDLIVDIVVSHTAPNKFKIPMRGQTNYNSIDRYHPLYDPSRDALDYILLKYHPAMWVFGHFHHFARGTDLGCSWFMLDTSIDADGCMFL